MEFKFAKLPPNPTKEEIKKEIERLKKERVAYDNINQSLKIILNSIYGVAGYIHFVCYNRDVAQSITKQSEDLIKYTIRAFNAFFKMHWKLSSPVVQKMGITKLKEVTKDIVNYADTDSVFPILNDDKLENVYGNTDFNGTFVEFVHSLNSNGLKAFIDKALDSYVKRYYGIPVKTNGSKSLKIGMEEICNQVLWVRKKRYIKDTLWKDGVSFEPGTKLSIKGLELNKSSTPKYAREKMKIIVDYIMLNDKVQNGELIKKLSAIKMNFKNASNIEDICKIERITDYEKMVLNDTTKIEVIAGAGPHVKGAALHNFLIKQNPELREKYQLIRSGDRVSWFYTDGSSMDSFAFIAGDFPVEIASKVNYNKQYETVFLSPLNHIMAAIGIKNLDANLTVFPSVFHR